MENIYNYREMCTRVGVRVGMWVYRYVGALLKLVPVFDPPVLPSCAARRAGATVEFVRYAVYSAAHFTPLLTQFLSPRN